MQSPVPKSPYCESTARPMRSGAGVCPRGSSSVRSLRFRARPVRRTRRRPRRSRERGADTRLACPTRDPSPCRCRPPSPRSGRPPRSGTSPGRFHTPTPRSSLPAPGCPRAWHRRARPAVEPPQSPDQSTRSFSGESTEGQHRLTSRIRRRGRLGDSSHRCQVRCGCFAARRAPPRSRSGQELENDRPAGASSDSTSSCAAAADDCKASRHAANTTLSAIGASAAMHGSNPGRGVCTSGRTTRASDGRRQRWLKGLAPRVVHP